MASDAEVTPTAVTTSETMSPSRPANTEPATAEVPISNDLPNDSMPAPTIDTVKAVILEAAVQEETAEQMRTEKAPEDPAKAALAARMARFQAAKKLAVEAKKQNLKDAKEEAKRLAADPSLLQRLERQRATAEHKLLKEETEDFERKRAWDWTVEESEKWDRRMEKKTKHRDAVAFSNFSEEAHKQYKRQMKELPEPSAEEIAQRKAEDIEKAVRRGDLELVEDEDGNVKAVDKTGTFYAQPGPYMFDHKPSEEAIDRLVASVKKDEERRLKNRRNRNTGDESGDVTYINEKNKRFNEKLARFYNKYTGDIRESFERGTAM